MVSCASGNFVDSPKGGPCSGRTPSGGGARKGKKLELLAPQRLELSKGRGQPGGTLIGRVGGGARAEIDKGQLQERALRVRGCAREVRGWSRGNAGQEDWTPVLGEVGVTEPKLPSERGGARDRTPGPEGGPDLGLTSRFRWPKTWGLRFSLGLVI